jgi:hypothetical protein
MLETNHCSGILDFATWRDKQSAVNREIQEQELLCQARDNQFPGRRDCRWVRKWVAHFYIDGVYLLRPGRHCDVCSRGGIPVIVWQGHKCTCNYCEYLAEGFAFYSPTYLCQQCKSSWPFSLG